MILYFVAIAVGVVLSVTWAILPFLLLSKLASVIRAIAAANQAHAVQMAAIELHLQKVSKFLDRYDQPTQT